MMTATETLAPAVPTHAQYVGTTPAGVLWMCYPRTGDTHGSFWDRFSKMRARLETIAARTAK